MKKSSPKLKIKVKEIPAKKLYGYDGMNPEANKQLGFKMKLKPNEIAIKKGMSKHEKVITIKHELKEHLEMKDGKSYGDAHKTATKYEHKRPSKEMAEALEWAKNTLKKRQIKSGSKK